MRNPQPGNAVAQGFLRLLFFVLALGAATALIQKLQQPFFEDLFGEERFSVIHFALWWGSLVAIGLFLGLALWLPVAGRGFRLGPLVAIALPAFVVTILVAVIFFLVKDDSGPDFLRDWVFEGEPVNVILAQWLSGVAFGAALVAGFCPAGYVPLARPSSMPYGAQPPPGQWAPPPQAAPPQPPPAAGGPAQTPPTSPGAVDPRSRPDNEPTRQYRPGGEP